jgi:two-component system sensor histidine kinase DesK
VPFLGLAVYAPVVLARLSGGRSAPLAIAIAVALLVAVGHAVHAAPGELLSLALVGALSSVAMRGFQRFIESTLALHRFQEEIAQMAKLEERARIARDLHDILGHSLSVVVLKSELAQALLGRGDAVDAGRELAELETVARAALSEVRGAVSGYRKTSFAAEVLQAPTTLATAGIRCDVEGELADLTDEQNSVLALTLREAVTNVVRHSAARRCRIVLGRERDLIRLTVQDDGRAGPDVEPGNGLQGMAERLRAAGGQLAWRGGDGFRLEVRLPEAR